MNDSVRAPIALPDSGLVYIVGDIDEELAAKAVLGMAAIKDDVHLVISTYGGSVFFGMAIAASIAALVKQGRRVVGEVRGHCFSAGNLILMACSKRTMAPGSWIGMHGMRDVSEGDMEDLETEMEFNKRLLAEQAELYASRSKLPRDYWDSLVRSHRTVYFNAEEGLEAGLIDDIL